MLSEAQQEGKRVCKAWEDVHPLCTLGEMAFTKNINTFMEEAYILNFYLQIYKKHLSSRYNATNYS